MSSIAPGEYPVGLDEDMGPEGTGSGPLGFAGAELNRSSTLLKFVGTIHQVCTDGMDHLLGQCLNCSSKHMLHIGYEPTYLFNLVGPEV